VCRSADIDPLFQSAVGLCAPGGLFGHQSLDKLTSIDTFTPVDTSEAVRSLFRKTKELTVEFCDRCARVCDAPCSVDLVRERALAGALRFGRPF
jgi:hypothetical protein